MPDATPATSFAFPRKAALLIPFGLRERAFQNFRAWRGRVPGQALLIGAQVMPADAHYFNET
jgi:hypothetical protein